MQASGDPTRKIVLEEGDEHFSKEDYFMFAQVRRFGSDAAGSLNHQRNFEEKSREIFYSMRLVT